MIVSSTIEEPSLTHGRQAVVVDPRGRHLFGPFVDFFCLGGGSLLVFSVLLALPPIDGLRAQIVAVTAVLMYVINQPHFANSYQIFYFGFLRKAFGGEYDTVLRARYIVAGIIVPIVLLLFFAAAIVSENVRMLAFGANIMLFLVGWHYAKQGYGIIIVDSVLKRRFFTDREKRILLINAYACWALYWLFANWLISSRSLWGFQYYSFAIPDAVLYCAAFVAAVTTATTLFMLAKKWRTTGSPPPVNGTVGYLTTLYAWLLFGRFEPILMLVVPAFHSLQYLLVVSRYRLNLDNARADGADRPSLGILTRLFPSKALVRFARFTAIGLALGYIGFWGMPKVFSSGIPYDHGVFGDGMFFFVLWIFINVHHYFLDNVIWRRESPDTGKYLFAHC